MTLTASITHTYINKMVYVMVIKLESTERGKTKTALPDCHQPRHVYTFKKIHIKT